MPYKDYIISPKKNFRSSKPISIIILAARPGYRMLSYGPPCLSSDCNKKTLLEHTIEQLTLTFPKGEIIVVSGFFADKLLKYTSDNVRIVENQLYETTNEIEDLRLGLNNRLYDSTLLISGDIYYYNKFIIPMKEETIIFGCNKDNLHFGYFCNENQVLSLSLSHVNKWSYIGYFVNKEMDLLQKFARDRNHSKLFLHEGINAVIDNGGMVKLSDYKFDVYKIYSSKEMKQLKNENFNKQ